MAVTDLWYTRDGEPSRRHGRGLRWRASWHGRAESYRTKRAAESAELRMRTEVPQRARDTTTVGDLLDVWVAGKAGLSPKGIEAVDGAAKHVRAEWGHEIAADLTGHAIQAWLAGMKWSGSLKHKVLQALAGACRIGVASGALDRNPCEDVKIPKERRREGRFLSAEQVGQLARADAHTPALIWLLATTGLRIGEAVALNVGDVDVKRRRLRVRRSKSGVGRDVPVPPKVLAMLDIDRDPTAPLFVGQRRRGRLSADSWRHNEFRDARDAVGLGDLRPHDLRHTAASLAIQSGASVKDVQTMLGHANAALTLNLYTHLWDRGLDDVAARMDALVT